jgi:hypothetical protein
MEQVAMAYVKLALEFLTSPDLPAKILVLGCSIATPVVVVGIAIWGIRGAFEAFRYLISL